MFNLIHLPPAIGRGALELYAPPFFTSGHPPGVKGEVVATCVPTYCTAA